MEEQKINISLEALKVAITQIGVKEEPVGSNAGKQVEAYLRSVGLGKGYPWCQAFVRWCYNEAALALGIHNPVVNTGGVMECWNKTSTNIKLFQEEALSRPELILPGSQFILVFGKGKGHTGIVESVGPLIRDGKPCVGKVIHTIEGNSNEDGSREGYEVVRHVRRLDSKDLLGFVRY